MFCSFSFLPGLWAGSCHSAHVPLSRAVCAPSGDLNLQTVEAKEMRGEGEAVDFIFNSHKKLLPTGTGLHCSYFSLLSLKTKIYPLLLYKCSLKQLWLLSSPPRDSKDTVASVSLALFLRGLINTLCLSEGLVLPVGHPQSITKKEETHWHRGTRRGCVPQWLEGWGDHRHLQENTPSFGLDFKHTGFIFSYQE